MISLKNIQKLSGKRNVDEECNHVGSWIYMNLLLVKNYHNFEMGYAMSLQQVSTYFMDRDIQNVAPSLNKLSVVWVKYIQRSLFVSIKLVVVDTKGQICDGSTSQNTLHGK